MGAHDAAHDVPRPACIGCMQHTRPHRRQSQPVQAARRMQAVMDRILVQAQAPAPGQEGHDEELPK